MKKLSARNQLKGRIVEVKKGATTSTRLARSVWSTNAKISGRGGRR